MYKVYTEQVALQPRQTYTIHAVLVPLTTAPTQPNNAQRSNHDGITTRDNTPTIADCGYIARTIRRLADIPIPGTGSLSVTTNPPGANILR